MLAWASCTDDRPDPVRGPQSIRVTLKSPSTLGTADAPLSDRDVVFDLELLDAQGKRLTMDRDVAVFAWSLGTIGRPPEAQTDPSMRCNGLAKISLAQGFAGDVHEDLSMAYGPVNLWVEDCNDPSPSYAVGASPTLWYAYPTIADLQRPTNPANFFAIFTDSPLQGKQVVIDASAGGKLVVTGVFAQFYTVDDTGLHDFNHVDVYSFSRPPVRVGDVLRPRSLTGAISEFNGMTELNFPLQDVIGHDEPLPPPLVITLNDLSYGSDQDKAMHAESLEAAVVELQDGCVCPADASYQQYQEWRLAVKNSNGNYVCNNKGSMQLLTIGQVPGWDPPDAGRHVSRVRGVLVNIAGQKSRAGNPYSFFLMYPRTVDDLVAAGDRCTTM